MMIVDDSSSSMIAQTAVHGGGSCQISLSYDEGTTWKVIHSFVGGCPLNKNLPITFPSDTPAGKGVLFAWTWLNHVSLFLLFRFYFAKRR